MRAWKPALVLGAVILLAAGAPGAKTLSEDTGPAEYPPSDYRGNQYVDSQGCVYIRAGFAGAVEWVPRVTRQRDVVCGQSPTFATPPVVADGPVRAAPKAPAITPASQPAETALALATRKDACRGAPVLSARYLDQPGKLAVRCGAVAPQPSPAPLRMSVTDPTLHAAPLPKGYKRAWSDDRLNPKRAQGTPAGEAAMDQLWSRTVPRRLVAKAPAAAVARSARPQTPVLATKSAPAPMIQVAAFANAANASALLRQLDQAGVPARAEPAGTKPKVLQIVLAGPFADAAALARALDAIRAAGYRDAFIRR